MISQISFTADEELKKRAMQKARSKGVTLKSVLIFSMQAFADGRIDVGIIPLDKDVEELHFKSSSIQKKGHKLATLLK